jgi:hypothetical protein
VIEIRTNRQVLKTIRFITPSARRREIDAGVAPRLIQMQIAECSPTGKTVIRPVEHSPGAKRKERLFFLLFFTKDSCAIHATLKV